MKQNADGREEMFHLVIGTPDEDNCPICKAHAKGGHEKIVDDALGAILIQELTLHEILRCSCPMCVQARSDSMRDDSQENRH